MTREEPHWDPSDPELTVRVKCMLDFRGHVVIPATEASKPMLINAVTSPLSTYNTVVFKYDDNVAIALKAKCISFTIGCQEKARDRSYELILAMRHYSKAISNAAWSLHNITSIFVKTTRNNDLIGNGVDEISVEPAFEQAAEGATDLDKRLLS